MPRWHIDAAMAYRCRDGIDAAVSIDVVLDIDAAVGIDAALGYWCRQVSMDRARAREARRNYLCFHSLASWRLGVSTLWRTQRSGAVPSGARR
jgi:hypothetical protein